jgi:hypothetical protein
MRSIASVKPVALISFTIAFGLMRSFLLHRDGGRAGPAFAGGAEDGERCWHGGNGGAISQAFAGNPLGRPRSPRGKRLRSFGMHRISAWPSAADLRGGAIGDDWLEQSNRGPATCTLR